jgi:hypothetical protein
MEMPLERRIAAWRALNACPARARYLQNRCRASILAKPNLPWAGICSCKEAGTYDLCACCEQAYVEVR